MVILVPVGERTRTKNLGDETRRDEIDGVPNNVRGTDTGGGSRDQISWSQVRYTSPTLIVGEVV